MNALDAAGPQAAVIARMFWASAITFGVVYLVVIAFLVAAIRRGRARQGGEGTPNIAPDPAAERRVAVVVGSAVAATTVILFAFLMLEIISGRALRALSHEPDPLEVTLTARQWWWEVRYEHRVASGIFTTANEIHIPVGRPVRIRLRSADVVHSFWVPQLHGKKDLVPGHPTVMYLRADRPGVYQAQCAEFCGHQHAHMRLQVVAQSPDNFERWRLQQLEPAGEPRGALEARGREVFLGGTCVMCHSVRGTPAGSRVGPDLTHLASRPMLGAGTIRNAPELLRAWIEDPSRFKPGTLMPAHVLTDDDVTALVAWLMSLR